MDFFQHQANARRSTSLLVVLYTLAVVAIVGSIHALVCWMLQAAVDGTAETFWELFFDPDIALYALGIPAAVIVFGTLFKIISLGDNGERVAASMGGRRIDAKTRDPDERRLVNIVEEMAIAAGIPIPAVYVMNKEPGINAFAAGYTTRDAAVAVTRGALDAFSRDELQAVVGHEFSHILNGDMRLNLKLIGVLGGIFGIAVAGRFVIEIGRVLLYSEDSGFSRKRDSKDNGGGLALGLIAAGFAVWAIGSIGVFFGRLIQCAISRKRETLADASAVQFTRNPDALASALKIIAASPRRSRVFNAHAAEVSHMLFANSGANLLATHPPLDIRIRRLEPGFDGDLSAARATLQRRLEAKRAAPTTGAGDDAATPFADLSAIFATAAAANAAKTNSAFRTPNSELSFWLGDEERDALRDASGAECALYGSILAEDAGTRATQLDFIRARHEQGDDYAGTADLWRTSHAKLTSAQRRAVCELAVETLRTADPATRAFIPKTIDAIARADTSIDAFEYMLCRMIKHRLAPDADIDAERKPPLRPEALARQVALVTSVLAYFGTADNASKAATAAAQAAWASGKTAFSLFGELTMSPPSCIEDFDAFDAALSDLVRLSPLAKREFVNACKKIVTHDGHQTDAEHNLFYAIADAVGVSKIALASLDAA